VRRNIKAPSPSSAACRRASRRPQLVSLEDRQPLGDALLGALLGASLGGAGLAALHAAPAPAGGVVTPDRPAGLGAPGARPERAELDVSAAPGLSPLLALFPEGQTPPRRSGLRGLAGDLGAVRPDRTGAPPGDLPALAGTPGQPVGAPATGEAAAPALLAGAGPAAVPGEWGLAGWQPAPAALAPARPADLALWAGLDPAGSASPAAGPAALRFDPATGVLTVGVGEGGGSVREAAAPGGYVEVSLAGPTPATRAPPRSTPPWPARPRPPWRGSSSPAAPPRRWRRWRGGT
jgi:hypothetical protein